MVMPLMLLLSYHTVAVVSMSLLVLRGAAASSSSTSRHTVLSSHPPLLSDGDHSVQHCCDSVTTASSVSDTQEPASSSSSTSTTTGLHPKPPRFSLRQWFAPRRTKTSVASSARSGAGGPLRMASSGSTVTGSGGCSDTTTMLCSTLVKEETIPTVADSGATAPESDLSSPAGPETHASEPSSTSFSSLLPTPPTSESVHLQLTGLGTTTPEEEQQHQQQTQNKTLVRVHSYVHHGQTYLALNTPKHKFRSFLEYLNLSTTSSSSPSDGHHENNNNHTTDWGPESPIRTMRVEYDAASRSLWRQLWKQRRLVTDRTELLAVYPSDTAARTAATTTAAAAKEAAAAAEPNPNPTTVPGASKEGPSTKRGGFSDLLSLYGERFAAILADEWESQLSEEDYGNNDHVLDDGLLTWLETHYGTTETRRLYAARFHALAPTHQLEALQHFLEWFRDRFPYYYDRCGHCGASMKEDMARQRPAPLPATLPVVEHHDNGPPAATVTQETTTSVPLGSHAALLSNVSSESPILEVSDDQSTSMDADELTMSSEDEENDEQGEAFVGEDDDDDEEEEEIESSEYQTFLGYIYPSEVELEGKASRTELYRCHACDGFTRFPRFNAAKHVLECRKGRCGEYSMLLYRFLRSLGHECRWVVDWSDHVWTEVWLTGKYEVDSAVAASSSNGGVSSTESPPRWVHLDPCEAAVDQNLLYQDWGKKQTYILGFCVPRALGRSNNNNNRGGGGNDDSPAFTPLIEDVTLRYTSDSWEAVCQRRDETEANVKASIAKAIVDLQRKLPALLAPQHSHHHRRL